METAEELFLCSFHLICLLINFDLFYLFPSSSLYFRVPNLGGGSFRFGGAYNCLIDFSICHLESYPTKHLSTSPTVSL